LLFFWLRIFWKFHFRHQKRICGIVQHSFISLIPSVKFPRKVHLFFLHSSSLFFWLRYAVCRGSHFFSKLVRRNS
jgi:hypothetical protein